MPWAQGIVEHGNIDGLPNFFGENNETATATSFSLPSTYLAPG